MAPFARRDEIGVDPTVGRRHQHLAFDNGKCRRPCGGRRSKRKAAGDQSKFAAGKIAGPIEVALALIIAH